MTPLYRRFLWRTVYGDAWRALGTSTKKPDGRVVITTCKGTKIENVHLETDPGRHPAGWFLRISGPEGDVWTIGPILSAESLPVPTDPPHFPPGFVENFDAEVLANADRLARHLEAERRDGSFLGAYARAQDLDSVVYPHLPDERLRSEGRNRKRHIEGLQCLSTEEDEDRRRSDKMGSFWIYTAAMRKQNVPNVSPHVDSPDDGPRA